MAEPIFDLVTQNTVVIQDLLPETTYIAEVRATGTGAQGSGVNFIQGTWSPAFEFQTITDTTPPSPVINLLSEIRGSTFWLAWHNPYEKEDKRFLGNFKDFSIRFYEPGNPEAYREVFTANLSYSLTIEDNRAAFETPLASLTFEVRVRDQLDQLSQPVTVTLEIPPLVPPTLSARGGTGNIHLYWSGGEGHVQRYEIYRAGSKVADVSAEDSTYNDSDAPRGFNEYFMRVYDHFGRYVTTNTVSADSGGFWEEDHLAPATPTSPQGSSSLDNSDEPRATATVSWLPPSTNSDGTEYDDHEGFEIRWRISSDRPWSYTSIPDDRQTTTDVNRIEAEITRLVPGATLYWGVRAFDRYGNRSGWLNHNFPLAVDDTPPDTPAGLTASGGLRTILASWERNANRVTGYRLYASTSPGVALTPANIKFEGLGTSASFTVDEQQTWYMVVTAYRTAYGEEYESSPTSEISATSLKLQDEVIPDNVTGVGASASTYYHGSSERARINVTWTPLNPAPAGYVVAWRRDNDAWSEEQVGGETAHFLLSSVEPGVLYSFRVKAISGSGNTSDNWSGMATATAPNTNGAIQREVSITTGGAIQSSNFDPAIPEGFSLDSNSIEIYGSPGHNVSIILGANGLNLNTETDQLWFGASTFNAANWRVDGDGNMRVGGATAFHANKDGVIWSGASTFPSAPWRIMQDGSSYFSKVQITGSDLATNDYLLNAGDDFTLRKVFSGFEMRVGGNLFVEGGGDVRIAGGGNLTIDSGNFSMNGGVMSLNSGSVLFNGAPVTLASSNLTVTQGSIIVDSGVNSTAPAVRSQDYSYSQRQGWGLDNGNLYLFSGEIDAAKMNIQDSPNLLDHGYTAFTYDSAWYNSNIQTNASATATLDTNWARYGSRSLKFASTASGAWLFFGSTTTDYNTAVEGGESYIVSAYVKNNNATARTFRFRLRRDNDAAYNTSTINVPSNYEGRVSTVIALPADTSSIIFSIWSDGVHDLSFDGIQLERRLGNNTSPSSFKIGGVTTIAGGQITTGSIQSSNYSATQGWSLPLSGNAVFGNGTFRGDIQAEQGYLKGLNIQGLLKVISGGGIDIGNPTNHGIRIDTNGIRMWQNGAQRVNIPAGGNPTFDGAITGGTINIGNGNFQVTSTGAVSIGNNFSVSNNGIMNAQGATITGNITANSGTFNGTVNATGGTFTGTVSVNGNLNVGINTSTARNIHLGLAGGNHIRLSSTDGIRARNGTTSQGFHISLSGALTANNASISGNITGSTISGSSLASTPTGSGSNLRRITIGATGGQIVFGGTSYLRDNGNFELAIGGDPLVIHGDGNIEVSGVMTGRSSVGVYAQRIYATNLGNETHGAFRVQSGCGVYGGGSAKGNFIALSAGSAWGLALYGGTKEVRSSWIRSNSAPVGGNVHVNSAGYLFFGTSSRRFKRDIEPLPLEKALRVLNAEAITYKAKPNNDDTRLDDWSYYGFIAEDIEENVDPRLVDFGWNDDGTRRADGLFYDRFVPLHNVLIKDLWESRNEHTDNIDALKRENEELRDRLTSMEERLTAAGI